MTSERASARHDAVRSCLSPAFHETYVLREALGEGATSVVFSGEQRTLRRPVVLKILTCDDDEMRQRFVNEANALSSIDHPGIVKLLDFGCDGPYLFIVMPRFPGETLEELVARGPLAWSTLVGVMIQLTAALSFLEEKGILHRDIKPSNIWIGQDGTAQLLDFGIARAGDGQGLTRPGHFLGSPAFSSPEQLLGDRLDHRSDLYSLGVTLLSLLTGHNPFASSSLRDSLQLHLGHHVRKVTLPPGAPPDLGALVVALLRKEPQARPWSAAEVRSRLEAMVAGSGPDPAAGGTERAALAPTGKYTRVAAGRPSAGWRVAVPTSLVGFGLGAWLAFVLEPPAPLPLPVPSPVAPVTPAAHAPALPIAELTQVRKELLACIQRARARQMTRVTLGFEQGKWLNADYGSRLLREEIDDFQLLDRSWSDLRKRHEVARLPLADRVLLCYMVSLRYLNFANLGAFKADAPPWMSKPPLDPAHARFFQREVTGAQGARAWLCLNEYLEMVLGVFVDPPVDGYEATVPLEHCLTFFDVSRAVTTYRWSPDLRDRVEALQVRIAETLAKARGAQDLGAAVAGMAWVAWRSGKADLTGGFTDLKVEAGSLALRLRELGVPLPEARFRGIFFYFYPGTPRPSYGPDFPFPPSTE